MKAMAGMFQNPLLGRRPTSKNVPLGLNEMPGDFVNAYVLGSAVGAAGIIGACATFLYNVRAGCEEITSGRKRLVLVGNSEAPVVPEVIEGYRTMGALMEDEQIMSLDGSDNARPHRRACRPFSSNGGFTVAESAVYTMIVDDELALELGAQGAGFRARRVRQRGRVQEVHTRARGSATISPSARPWAWPGRFSARMVSGGARTCRRTARAHRRTG